MSMLKSRLIGNGSARTRSRMLTQGVSKAFQ
jgi:hypothetical protein